MSKNDVFCPLPCAEEIVKVLEKHKVSILNMEKVLATAKDIAIASTKVQSEKESSFRLEESEKEIGKNPFSL